MPAPRILIFSLAYFPFVGGAEVAVKEITDRLSADKAGLTEYEFEIISADIRSFWSKYFYPFWAYRRAARQHRAKNYDLIWAIMANQAGMTGALFKRRFPRVPFLLTLQEGDELTSLSYRLRLLGPRFFGVFRRADYLTAISNYLARWARQMGAKCPVTIVPNGVGLEKLKTGNQRPDLKEIPRSGLDQKTIITTSRLVKKNGVDTLIETMRFLPDNVQLQILGVGPEEKSLKQLMSRLNLDKRVKFLGQVAPNEIPNHLAQADVFVRPSRSEGLGNSFIEAMAAGVPVIGTPVGGIPDFLVEGQTGWFCEVDNPQSIADKVRYILNPSNRHKVDQIITNAKNLVREKYDWSIISQKMAQIMTNLLSVDR